MKQYFSSRSWIEELAHKISKRPLHLMKHVLCSNGSWIDGNSSVHNRSWIYDTYFSYFSLYRPIYLGGKALGEMSGLVVCTFWYFSSSNLSAPAKKMR